MPYGFKGLSQLAAKVQDTFGTAHTTMDNTCLFAPYLDDCLVEFKQEPTAIRIANNAFGVQKNVYGIATVDINVSFPLGVTGSSTEPHVAPFLKASGLKVTTATSKHTYQPSALYTDWKDLTVWGQTGDRETGDGMLTKAYNAMFGFTCGAAKVGDPSKITFKGLGIPVALPAAASYITGTQTQPTDVYPPLMAVSACSVGGKTYRLQAYELQWNTNPVLVPDAAGTFGGYRVSIGNDPRATIKITLLQEQFASLTPWADSKTAGTLTLTWGSAGSRVSITSGASKFMFDPPVMSDSDGIQTIDITGVFIDNDFNLIINEA